MIPDSSKDKTRRRIHQRLRNKLSGSTERPRLNVYRSLNHIYVQVIDDTSGTTLASASTVKGKKGGKKTGGNVASAKEIGKEIAQRAQEKGIKKVVFDRGGYLYHGRMAIATKKKLDAGNYQLKDQVVAINRVTKVVKGGKNMSFAALVVVGDPSAGVVGYGSGKAKEVPQAIRKGIESAKKNLMRVNLSKTSIPHAVLGTFGSGRVLLKPAPEGTGVIAGGAVRAVMTSVGVQNVLTKSIGTANPHNVIKATFDALFKLRDRQDVATLRGKSLQEL
jgi:small subunit ribosomal protein S5